MRRAMAVLMLTGAELVQAGLPRAEPVAAGAKAWPRLTWVAQKMTPCAPALPAMDAGNRMLPVVNKIAAVAPMAAQAEATTLSLAPVPEMVCTALAVAPGGPVYESLSRVKFGLGDYWPAYSALKGTSGVFADPLISPTPVWGGGPLGMLRKQALDARARGDEAQYERFCDDYFRMLSAALERRRVFEEWHRQRNAAR